MAETTKQLADELRLTLDGDHYVAVTKNGKRFFICEDEDATGFFAWPDTAVEDTPAVASFGECDLDENDDPDYRALSERIAAWLSSPEATNA